MNRFLSYAEGAMSMDIYSGTTLKIKKPGGKKYQDNQDAEGFTKTQNKKRQARKTSGPELNKRVQTQNRYEILQEDKEIRNKGQQS